MAKLPPNILSTAKPGKYSDGAGLYLTVTGNDDRGSAKGYWVYRYSFQKAGRRDMGLGSVKDLTLKQAREERDKWKELLRQGIDPKAYREEQESKAALEIVTFADIAEQCFESHRSSLKGESNAQRWFGPVRLHILPALGSMPIEQIHQRDIADALRGIWATKYPTAKKVIDRLVTIYRYAAAHGLDVNLSTPEHARLLLGKPRHKAINHPALPLDQVSRLFNSLDPENTPDRALMLYLLIGGGTRLKPLREAHVSQFEGDLWSVPQESMKGRSGAVSGPFRVPLTSEALALVEMSKKYAVGGYLFPSRSKVIRPDGHVPVVSDQSIENIFRDREEIWGWSEPYRPHGIRAAFRTWAGANDPMSFTVAETALAHTVAKDIERRYDRNDYLDQRRSLLEDWGSVVRGEE